ncbi:MAG TPA: hypothetical protein VFJ82_13350 [Longimicrobium sp.]|nr:hypothetical protein [Longimicrobium sp.]
MNGGLWLAEGEALLDPAGLSEAASFVDRSIRNAVSHWNETITSERAGLYGQFRHFTQWWKHDTEYQSSPTRIAMHPAYQRIIGMGREALPFILKDLEATRAPWFWALHAITGEDPVPEEDRGHIDRMTRAWVRWGMRKNLV